MHVVISQEVFYADDLVEKYQKNSANIRQGSFGACVRFTGTMRDFNGGDSVKAMFLEHYPQMTKKHLGEMVEEACSKKNILDILVAHRVGWVYPGEDIVIVCVWSVHRKPAFLVCEEVMEQLKKTAVFWKKEVIMVDGNEKEHRWVTQSM